VQECLPHSGRAVLPGFGRIEHVGQPWLPSTAWLGIRGRRAGPWPSSLAPEPCGWAQIATFVVLGLLIVILAAAVRDQLPRRRAGSCAVVLLALLGVALILAAFRFDMPILSGGNPETWHGWVQAIAFLLIIATGVLAPLWLSRCAVIPAGGRSGCFSRGECALRRLLVLAMGQRHISDGDRHPLRLDGDNCGTPSDASTVTARSTSGI
jgi:Protein of unknown function (DUF998)